MDTPIKVGFITSSYGNHTAFVCEDMESISTDTNKAEAILSALLAAGRVEVVDIDQKRRDKIMSRHAPQVAARATIEDDITL